MMSEMEKGKKRAEQGMRVGREGGVGGRMAALFHRVVNLTEYVMFEQLLKGEAS